MVNIHKIRLLAAEKGVKLSFLISKIGLKSRTYFQDVEKRNSDIPEDKLQIIAQTLGTTVEYLRDETDDPEIKKPSMVSWKGVEMSEDRAKLMDYIASLSDEQAEKIYRILKEIKGL